MTHPRISIVTPSFNQGKYIEQTILSVLNQNYPNLEYIIIDGGSKDNTVEIIKKYEHLIHYWISEPDNGQTDAINKGFSKCTGDIFNWINSDDFYEPDVFNILANLFSDNPSVNVVCGKEWAFNDGSIDEKILNNGSVIKKNVFETIRVGIIDQPCTFFRRESIASFFPLDTSLQYVMDRQLWWSYLMAHGQDNILVVDSIFTNFRLHTQSKSIKDAFFFEQEFDRLKCTLFNQLNAPAILKQQIEESVLPITAKFPQPVVPCSKILAAFCVNYAEVKYVKEEMAAVKDLMQYVKKVKRFNLDKKELKLWLLSNVVPARLFWMLKKIKRVF